MECDEAKKLYVDYLDDELSPEVRRDFEAHLDQCPECSGEMEEYRKTMEEVSGLIPLTPTQGFSSRVKKTIDRRSRGRFFSGGQSYSMKFALISFILILIVLLTYYYVTAVREVKVIEPGQALPSDPDKAEVEARKPGAPRGALEN